MRLKILRLTVLFALFFKTDSQDFLSILKGDVHNKPMALCLPNIATAYFKDTSTVGVALIDEHHDDDPSHYDDNSFLKTISDEMRWSVLSLHPEDCMNELYYRDHSFSSNETTVRVHEMIIIGEAENVVRYLEQCDVRILINERSRFVVGLEDSSSDDTFVANVQKVLDALWVLDQVNVAVLIMTESYSVDIYSWFPITDDAKPYVLDTCTNGSFRLNTNLFPADKISTNLQGFKVRFGAVTSPPFVCKTKEENFIGFEDKIYKVLAERLNFTLVYHFFETMSRFEGTLTSVRLRQTDVTIGGFLQKPERFRSYGSTTTILRDTVEWYVGGDWIYSEMDKWARLVIMCNMGVYFISSLTMRLIFNTERRKKNRSYSVWLMVWSLWAEVPSFIRSMPWRRRVFWAFCAFYIVNMNAISKSVITSVLTQPLYVTQINTVHQLFHSDVPILPASPPPTRNNLFPDEKNVSLKRIQDRMLNCPNSRDRQICVGKQLEKGALSVTILKCFMKVMTDFLPKGTFHVLDRPVATLQMISYTRKNYFLLPEFRRQMSRFIEVGLVQHWQSEFERHPECDMPLGRWKTVFKGDSSESEESLESKFATITFARMQDVFQCLLLAYGLSFLIFLYEIMSYHNSGSFFKKRPKERRDDLVFDYGRENQNRLRQKKLMKGVPTLKNGVYSLRN